MEKKRYDILEEPRGETYAALIRWLEGACSRDSLVILSDHRLNDEAGRFLETLGEHEMVRSEVTEWPGTRLTGRCAELLEFDLHWAAPLLISATPGLYGWLSPDLPEDLAAYRSDGSVCLLSSSHEPFSEMFLSDGEMEELRGACPDLKFELME